MKTWASIHERPTFLKAVAGTPEFQVSNPLAASQAWVARLVTLRLVGKRRGQAVGRVR